MHLEHGFLIDSGSPASNEKFFDRRSTLTLFSKEWGEVRLGRDFVPSYTAWSRHDPFAYVGAAPTASVLRSSQATPARRRGQPCIAANQPAADPLISPQARVQTSGATSGHIWFGFSQPIARAWPGLLTTRDDQGLARVAVNDDEPGVPLGAQLLACDGQDADALQRQWVDPYRWNADIPHERNAGSVFLMTAVEGDPRRPRVCRFRDDGLEVERTLRWTSVSQERLANLLDRASGRAQARIGLRQVGPVWFVSMPTFHLQQAEQVEAMRALIRELGERAETLRTAPWVVLDVRGNTGGNSGWGGDVAAALFGEASVDRVEGQFDWTVDWRASPLTAASLRQGAEVSEKNGQLADAKYRRELADEIEQAAAAGMVYLRKPAPARFAAGTHTGESPLKGRVFLLTDHACASACLDFADCAFQRSWTPVSG